MATSAHIWGGRVAPAEQVTGVRISIVTWHVVVKGTEKETRK